jgi:hypothetical protein
MKGTDANELPAFLLEDNVISNDIDDVRPFLDGLDRAGMETGIQHAAILRSHAGPSSD